MATRCRRPGRGRSSSTSGGIGRPAAAVVSLALLAGCGLLPSPGPTLPGPAISSPASEEEPTMDDLRDCLPGRWLHSREEDTTDETIYRPSSYRFPPARGRTGFELRPDGSAVSIGIAATDGPSEAPGRWALEGPDELRVTLDRGGEPRVLHVRSCEPDRLVLGP